MRELCPHIAQHDFLHRVRTQVQAGCRMAFISEQGGVVAVTGLRPGENLAWVGFLYVDD